MLKGREEHYRVDSNFGLKSITIIIKGGYFDGS